MTDPLPDGITSSFVHLDKGAPGVLYEPERPTDNSRVGILLMHANGDYLSFTPGLELARRGYRVLCANNSTSKTTLFDDGFLDGALLQLKAAVAYLRDYPGIDRVVLFGHSGGATLMTAYQMIAEGGVAAARGPGLIHQCPDELAGLPAADAVVLADSNWGQSGMVLLSVDPAIADENSGMLLNPALDMYEPANGFVPTGSTYGTDFVEEYLAAQGKRNNAIIERALDRLALIEAGQARYEDDEPFFVPGATYLGFNNKLLSQDVRLLSRSVRAWPLVHADGSTTEQVITTVRPPMNTKSRSRSLRGGALKTTVRNFLSSYAIRVSDDYGYGESSLIRGVQWDSSYSNPPGNVAGITAPMLVLGMTGGWECLAAETIHDRAASIDKTLAFIEGADHNFRPRTPAGDPAAFGDTVKNTFDFVDGWLSRPGRLLP